MEYDARTLIDILDGDKDEGFNVETEVGVDRQELEPLLQDFLDKAKSLSGYDEEQLRDAAMEFAYATLRFQWPPRMTFNNLPFRGRDGEKGFYERGKYASEKGHELLRKDESLRNTMDRLYYENVKRKL